MLPADVLKGNTDVTGHITMKVMSDAHFLATAALCVNWLAAI
jgi:hypothetical protein